MFKLNSGGVVLSAWSMIFTVSMFVLCFFFLVENEEMALMLELEFSSKFLILLNIPFFIDASASILSSVVLFISSFVMIFSGFYMSHEVFMARFISLVVLFVLSMNFLIFFPSFLILMVGWDGLGVVSFLLVIYYMNKESLSAGMITAISNRVGDVFFIISIGCLSSYLGFDFFSFFMFKLSVVMSFLVVIGSMTKSAQVPFSAWLPAAMAAPTPVSTLVHSSTLVTAGVYVLYRFSSLISLELMLFLLFFSMMTLIMAGCGAILEVDMKKVIALSTLSQLGVMMLSISLGMKMVALFHLIVHAFFKALMFMCVGAVIFYSGGVQDGRLLGESWRKLPVISMWLVVCNMSLMGLPFMSGFYSKDLVLEMGMVGGFSGVGLVVFLISIVLTVLYGVRMILMVVISDSIFSFEAYSSLNSYLFIATLGLGFGAIWGGYFIQSMMKKFYKFVFLSSYLKMSILFSLVFSVFIMVLYFSLGKLVMKSNWYYYFFGKMWFLPSLSGNFLSSWSLQKMLKVNFYLEKSWLESLVWGSGLKGLSSSFGYMVHGSQAKVVGLLSFIGVFLFFFLFLL
uniref:NADH-ubiquinone oxidoreductase chain 5 n=1 Tax=Villorita cyprinoides TaxID=1176411 RepID=A0A7L7YVT2_9BIVA|nr:NADH dehydrogenase subunit 5 [Villorita cyprinoides]QOD40732.1 NADH dehydrogenase subunit 5 [Villorita cyprinoides]